MPKPGALGTAKFMIDNDDAMKRVDALCAEIKDFSRFLLKHQDKIMSFRLECESL